MTWDETQTASSNISYTEWNNKVTALKGTNCISVFWPGVVGAAEVTVLDNFEFPVDVTVTRGYAYAKTAPGAGYNCTVKITDGTTPKTFTIATTAHGGEDEAINQDYDADTDMSITLLDDNASAVTADVNIIFWFEPR